MIAWLKKIIATFARRQIGKMIDRMLDAEDYQAALLHSAQLLQRNENDLLALNMHLQALLGLKKYENSLEIISQIEHKQNQGILSLSIAWKMTFAQFKCRSLYELHDFEKLSKNVCRYRELYPEEPAFPAYHLLLAFDQGIEPEEACVQFLDKNISTLNKPCYFIALVREYDRRGNDERAREVAEIALQRFPNEESIKEMVAFVKEP